MRIAGSVGPAGARRAGCGDDDLAGFGAKLDFVAEPSLLDEQLGETDPWELPMRTIRARMEAS